jgi:hypothetical protein
MSKPKTPRKPTPRPSTATDPLSPAEAPPYRDRHDEPDESGAARDAESIEGHGGRGDGPVERG